MSVRDSEFRDKTLRLLKLARAALIYLALAVRREERLRSNGREPGWIGANTLPPYEDRWKH